MPTGKFSIADAKPLGQFTASDVTTETTAPPAKPPSMNFAIVNGRPVDTNGDPVDLDALIQAAAKAKTPMKEVVPLLIAADQQRKLRQANYAPAVMGALGGIVGGIPGAAALGAVGGAVKQTVQRMAGVPEAPQGVVAQGKDIALDAATQGGAQAFGAGVGAGMKWLGPQIMQSAVKPGVVLMKEYQTTAPAIVKTLIDEGINVTEGGIAKLQTLLKATNDHIRAAIQDASGTIDKRAVASRVLPTAAKLGEQVNPGADLKAVGDVVGEFMDHPIYQGQTLSLPEAQAMKVGTYQQIGKKYGEVSSANIEAQKALARGLKEEIAAKVPQVQGLNAKDAQLMAALDAVGRRVAMAGNRDPIGFAWVTHNPMTFIAALMDRSPIFKSLLARGLYDEAGKAAQVAPQLIRAAVVSMASDAPAATPSSTDAPDGAPRRP